METIKKISVEAILGIFEQLYHSGVDYVDLSGEIKQESDVLHITFTKEYIDPEFLENFEEDTEQSPSISIRSKLTDDDISKLI